MSLLALLHGKTRRRLLHALALALLAHYLSGVRQVKLHRGRGGTRGSSKVVQEVHRRLKRIVQQCPSLAAVYWPTFYAYTALAQFCLLGLKEVRARVLQRSPYTREVLTLRDRSRIALDWVPPVTFEVEESAAIGPVCVLLHGAFQDSACVTMTDLARSLAARGMPVVVMNRRGYGGLKFGETEAARLTMYGIDEDLDEVLGAVGRRYPHRPVAIIGFSCGSSFAARFAGNRSHLSAWDATGNDSRRPRLLCSVAYDPMYDISHDGAVLHVRPPFSWVLNWAIKYCYAFRHRHKFRNQSASFSNLLGNILSPQHSLKETYRKTRHLSGAIDSSAWMDMQQPCMEGINVPSLLINSRDDPICVWANVEEYKQDIVANPNLVLAELQRGSHGCKYGFWGGESIADVFIGEFVFACWCEFRASSSSWSELRAQKVAAKT
ncbi:unnamed protein product [Polarella glacialis]|uniref:AB hydrolase-1 domain-containing protein n=1 Tax=Polarella glacialis TaxID=89957 RepID=A0A813GFU7_POLGL|nr:unnamed protein product [Polarella glacialis]